MPVTKPYLGHVSIKKQGGSGAISTGTQIMLPAARAVPSNPFNHGYPGAVNVSSFPSLRAEGKRTPGAVINTFIKPYDQDSVASIKPGWSSADTINSLLMTLDSSNNTDKWALGFKDDQASGLRTWDWSRCSSIRLYQTAPGGPIFVTIEFLSRWGNTECPYGTTLADGEVIAAATTFTTPSTDAGQLTGITGVDFGSTATLSHVRSWSLELMRGQGHVFFVDGTKYAKDIASTMFSGIFTVEQSPLATTTISDTGTVTIRISTDKTATTGRFKFDCNVSLDSLVYPQDISLGNTTRVYSLVNLSTGGNPATVTAY